MTKEEIRKERQELERQVEEERQRLINERRFIHIDGAIMARKELDLNKMVVLGIIYNGCRSNPDMKWVASYRYIADLSHLSERTVIRTVQYLHDNGYLVRWSPTFEGEKSATTHYSIKPGTSKIYDTMSLSQLNHLNDKLSHLDYDKLSHLKEKENKIILTTNNYFNACEFLNGLSEEVLMSIEYELEKRREDREKWQLVSTARAKWIEED